MALLSSMIVWAAEGNIHKDGHVKFDTAEERAVDTFKFMLKLNSILMAINAVLSLFIG